MFYTPNNSAFTKLQLVFTALSNFNLMEIISHDESVLTVHFKNTNLDLFLLRQHLEMLLDCELIIISDDTTGLCSFNIIGSSNGSKYLLCSFFPLQNILFLNGILC